MDQDAITAYITTTFAHVNVATNEGDLFYMYDPDPMFPFATFITRDNDFDSHSKLDRPGVFRLNIGVSKATFQGLLRGHRDRGDHDYTAQDALMPHPVYGRQYWVSVLNPTDATFDDLRPMLAEAYRLVVDRNARKGIDRDMIERSGPPVHDRRARGVRRGPASSCCSPRPARCRRDTALSLEDGYRIGRLPWIAVGVDLVVIGATVAVIAGTLSAWIGGGWIRRTVTAGALVVAAFWWVRRAAAHRPVARIARPARRLGRTP